MHMLRFEDFQCPYSLMICLVSAALLRLDWSMAGLLAEYVPLVY
jgi:hypothetical protein